MSENKERRPQKKYCDSRCWDATGMYCSCWCHGMNHGLGKIPDGFDPKKGMTEAEYEASISRDHKHSATDEHPSTIRSSV